MALINGGLPGKIISFDAIMGRLFTVEMKTTIGMDHFDTLHFFEYYKQVFGENLEELSIDRINLLEDLKLVHEDRLRLAGALLFGKEMETLKPRFSIKATCYITEDEHRDKEDIGGKSLINRKIRNSNRFYRFTKPFGLSYANTLKM